MQKPSTKWSELSSDEEEKTGKKKVEQTQLSRSNQQQDQPQQQSQQSSQQYQKQKKPNMQTRQEIEKLIEDHLGQEVVLNIVKCHFDATEEDVQKAFPDSNITEVQKYNPGSFSLKFLQKADAKEFVYSSKEVKILDRGFWVKFPIFHQKTEGIGNKELSKNERLSKKTYDSQPKKNRENYNRKSYDEQEDQEGGVITEDKQVGFYRSDQKQTVPSSSKPQQRQYNNKKQQQQNQNDEEDEWETVQPNFHTKSKQPGNKNSNRRK